MRFFARRSSEMTQRRPGQMSDFAISSQGRTASYWFAAALHAHDDITCGHSKQNPPIVDFFGDNKSQSLDAVLNDIEKLPEDPAGYTQFLHGFGDTAIFGSVHAFGVWAADDLIASDLSVAHMTRHPIARVTSLADRNFFESQQSEQVKTRIEKTVNKGLRWFGALKGLREIAPRDEWAPFVAACLDVAYEAVHIEKFDLVLQSERLTSDPDYFAWAVRNVTGVRVTTDYLEKVFSMGRLNGSKDFRGSAGSTFARWPEWRKDIFKLFFDNYPLRTFEQYQYDLSGILEANFVDGRWLNVDKTAIETARQSGLVVRNMGDLNPEFVGAGTIVELFAKIDGKDTTNLSLRLDRNGLTWQTNTVLLGRAVPQDADVLKVTFQVPVEAGIYAVHAGGEQSTIIDTELVVGDSKMRLSDQDLVPGVNILRAAIEPIS